MLPGDIVYEIPEGLKLCPDIRNRAIAYMRIQSMGITYWVPITKEMKRFLKLKVKDGKIVFASGKQEDGFEKMCRDILWSVHLQERDVVLAGIEENISKDVRDGFAKLFEAPIKQLVRRKMVEKLPPPGGNDERSKRRSSNAGR